MTDMAAWNYQNSLTSISGKSRNASFFRNSKGKIFLCFWSGKSYLAFFLKVFFVKMISAKMLEDLADRYDTDWFSDGNIKTISYPAREPYNSRKKVSPMMMKMRERMKFKKQTFDRTFSKANGLLFLCEFLIKILEFKTNITNNIEHNPTVGKIRLVYNHTTNKIMNCLAEIGLINGKTPPIANK